MESIVSRLVAKECLNVQSKYVASFNARIGSMVPDFAWYLRNQCLISAEDADRLHGIPPNNPSSRMIPHTFTRTLRILYPGGLRVAILVRGIGSHVCADMIAHNETRVMSKEVDR